MSKYLLLLKFIKTHIAGILLFVGTLILGLCIYPDYGIAWDDTTQREIGQVSYNYVFHNDDSLLTYRDKDYGVGIELPLIIIEKQLGLTDLHDIFLMRHLVTHLFFLLSMLVGYFLIYGLFGNRLLALMGFIMLVFHPRIYAHSFFNTKDVPFLALFLLSLAAIYLMIKKDKTIWYLLAGFVIGYACATRIMGVILFGFVSLSVLVDIIVALRQKESLRKYLINYSLFIIIFLLTVYAAWPYLWSDPFVNFGKAYSAFSHYRWHGEVMFRGNVWIADSLPWIYLPVWIGISTPILWLIFAVSGIVLVLLHFCTSPFSFVNDKNRRNFLIYLGTMLMPVLAVIIMHSVVYDDWRHLYFIYPSLVMLMLYAANYFSTKGKAKIVAGALTLQLLLLAIVMIREHPFQQVFFNSLVSHKEGNLKKNYEMDYWGCSYKDGLEWVLANDTGKQIKVAGIKPLTNNHFCLPEVDRNRIREVDEGDKPYYLLTNYRFAYRTDSFNFPLVHRIKSGNSPIMDIYRVEP